jgi:hypothetical protein
MRVFDTMVVKYGGLGSKYDHGVENGARAVEGTIARDSLHHPSQYECVANVSAWS